MRRQTSLSLLRLTGNVFNEIAYRGVPYKQEEEITYNYGRAETDNHVISHLCFPVMWFLTPRSGERPGDFSSVPGQCGANPGVGSLVGTRGGDNHGNAPLLPGYQESSLISCWLKSLCYLKLLLSNICLVLSSHKDKAGNVATCCVFVILTPNPPQISSSLQEQINYICCKADMNFNKSGFYSKMKV